MVNPTRSESKASEIDVELDKKNLQPKFYVPRSERACAFSHLDICDNTGWRRQSRSKRTCPTRDLNFQHTQWDRHKSPYRKIRHLVNVFNSASFQRLLFPDLFCTAAIAGCLTYYNELIAVSQGMTTLGVNPGAFAGATTAIRWKHNHRHQQERKGRKCQCRRLAR